MPKPISLAANRAIHASDARGVDVPMSGSMRPLREPSLGTSVHIPKVSPPRVPKLGAMPGMKPRRRYYGEGL